MDESVVGAEKPMIKRKRDAWYYAMALGNWFVIFVLLGTCFYIYSQAEVLKTSPCQVCEEELGMMCSPVPKYVTDQKKDDVVKLKYPLDTLTSLDLEGVK